MVKKDKVDNKVTTGVQFEISKGSFEEIGSLAKANKMKPEELLTVFKESVMELESKGVKNNVERLAMNGVKNYIRKLTRKNTFTPKAKAVAIVGFIIGDAGLWDKIENMRNAAKRYVEKNGIEAAIENNFINGDNQVLDQRKELFGKENIHYLEPLDAKVKDMSRTLHLIARLNGAKEYKYGTLQTNDPSLARGWSKIKFFVPCTTFAIVKEDILTTEKVVGEFKLNSSQAEETTTIFKAIKDDAIDVDKIFMEVVTPMLTKIGNVEKTHEALKGAWDRRVFVRGTVAWINRDRPSPWGSIWMGLMDDNSNEVRVSIPEQIAADFGELSEVIAFGKTNRKQTKDQQTEKYVDADVAIDAIGIYPIKGLVTPSNLNKPESLEDSPEIEGWVE